MSQIRPQWMIDEHKAILNQIEEKILHQKKMENKICSGLMGKIFGHKFEEYCIESFLMMSFEGIKGISASELMRIIESTKQKTNEIRCKRCGAKADE